MRNPARSASVLPSVLVVGGVQLTVALPVAVCSTVIEKPAMDTLLVPSDTLITTFEAVPTSVIAGVPDRRPVAVLKVNQAGLLSTRNVSVSPSGSVALGWKL